MVDPLVVSLHMGYGHLRAGQAICDALGVSLLEADSSPLADEDERRRWQRLRTGYELLCRASQAKWYGGPLRRLLDEVTSIAPVYSTGWVPGQLGAPNVATRVLDAAINRGLGQGMIQRMRQTGAPLVTTFYTPAIIADKAGVGPIYCVVTDADIHRIWAPMNARSTSIEYLAPSWRVVRRLQSYGVPEHKIVRTGFPLPPSLLGGEALDGAKAALGPRLVRLDPNGRFRRSAWRELDGVVELPQSQERQPPTLAFAVGGAGTQLELVERLVPSLREWLNEGRIRLVLVAGTRPDVAAAFGEVLQREDLAHHVGNAVTIIHEPTFSAYYRAFNEALKTTDILWTKPSELSFYAALGIPIVAAEPIGMHERYNRQWLREHGAALKQRHPDYTPVWLEEWLRDGTLAAAAWSGFRRLPNRGTFEIVERLRGPLVSRGGDNLAAG